MHTLGKAYCDFCRACNYLQSPILLLIRLYWGWQFFQGGIGKFGDIGKVAEFFNMLHIPIPTFSAYLVATVETVGGLLLLIGLFSRFAALFLVITMIGAYITAALQAVKTIFIDPELFFKQPPFLYLYASLIVLAFGAGFFSLDYLMQRRSQKCRNGE